MSVVSVKIPDDLDWFVWRPIVHERGNVTLHEMREHWTLDDLFDAHLALDVIDELAFLSAQPQK